MQTCPHCGERVEDRDIYCFECGTRLDGERDEPVDQRARPSESPARRTGGLDDSSDDRSRTTGRGYTQGERPPERRENPPDSEQRAPVGYESTDNAGYSTDTKSGTRVTKLTTLWIALVAAAVGALENAGALLLADELAEQMAEFGFGDISAGAIAAQGGLGLVLTAVIVALCLYYYRQGYVDRRFYWGLLGIGVLGIFLGAALSFLVHIGVGAYGLLVVLKRAKRRSQPGPGRDEPWQR